MVATIFFEIGINISDIERILIWKFPIGYDIFNIWQRFGCDSRGLDRIS
jgi:hypothetical protein